MWEYLKQHPQIAMPDDFKYKEPSFFSLHYRFRLKASDYLNLFAGAEGKMAIGEASHAYLSSPESAELIHDIYPDAKIIIILRNPVDRAFSLYQWMFREGYEWLFPFEKALAAEEERLNDKQFEYQNPQYYYNYLYYYSGLYSEQILRYLTRFPKEQMRILLFEDLKYRPLQIVQELYEFLGVDLNFTPVMEIHNKAQMPLWGQGQYFLKQRLPKLLKRYHVPMSLRKWLTQQAVAMNLSLGNFRSLKLNPATRRYLLDCYRDDIRKTSQVIGRNLDMWLTLPEK
ncbi:sulfotransferase [Candidatus Moduliflexus flocculans]|uniref:Sulfotransferase n=1 Tax=Candidatus Moduliflexus flocculans TaxID=1499966 RepID=A0A0S6VXB9_9BACT|nr:sulfotransferase [Candidatus Moduliflexus flocculans]